MIILRLPTLSVQKSCRILQPSFSSILELEQLKNERNELQLSVQKDQLHTVYLVLIFVVLFWIMSGILFFRIYKLNKRLKASELIVNKQNKT